MVNTIRKYFFLLAFITIFSGIAHASNLNSPIGEWITIDRATQKPSGIVRITEQKGMLSGKIIAGFHVDPILYCTKCSGSLKNQPVIGMTFLWGFSPQGQNKWNNGSILNPHDGKVYRGSIVLTDHGKKLLLRGYWGIFFQTQTWIRRL